MRAPQSSLTLALLLTVACTSAAEPAMYNAGTWESLPNPGGATEIFSLDTSGTAVRGEGEYGGFINQPARKLRIAGRLSSDSVYLVFLFADGSRKTYSAAFVTPSRLEGTMTTLTAPPVPSIVYLRH